jgi:hypothetical protein
LQNPCRSRPQPAILSGNEGQLISMALIRRRIGTGIRMRALVVAAALQLMTTNPAAAMIFKADPFDGGYVLVGTGDIVQGDRVRLVTAIDSVPLGQKTIGLALASPGGNIFEAEKLADTVRSSGLVVIVLSQNVCASACFLVFAAARTRMAAVDARIGVHSVSERSSETLNSMGFTTAFARDVAGYGVPPAIIGRMVTTAPGQMAWLSTAELMSMGTQMVAARAPKPEPQAPTPTQSQPNPSGPVAMADPLPSNPSASFQQGASDRRTWEAWVASLDPDTHAGADYWAAQRSLKSPGSCVAPPTPSPQNPTNWSAGCLAAKMRLGQSDLRRKSEPDYKAGWNSI